MPIEIISGGNVEWVVINRADRANAFDYGHLIDLASKLREACESGKPVVSLIGAGEKYFSAGIDLKEVASLGSTEDSFRLFIDGMGSAIEAIVRCGRPVVAAVNGYAVGLGFEIVQAADLAYAVKGAKLGSPAIRWGMIPPVTPFTSYNKITAELTYTGKLLDAEEALRLGLINGVADTIEELKKTVEDVGSKIEEMEEWAVSEVKRITAIYRLPLLYEGLRAIAVAAGRKIVSDRINKYFLERKKK